MPVSRVGLPGEMTQILIPKGYEPLITMSFSNQAAAFVHLLSKLGKCVPRNNLVDELGAKHILP